jgi:hypothetical protein
MWKTLLQAGLGLGLLVEFLLLSFFLSLHRWLPERGFEQALRPSPEALVGFALLLILGLLPVGNRPILARAWRVAAAAIPLAALSVYSFAEGVVRHFYQRSFEPGVDLAYLSVVPYMLFGESLLSKAAVYWPLITAALLMAVIAYGLFGELVVGTVRSLPWPTGGAIVVVLIAVLWGLTIGYSEPLVDEVAAQLRRPIAGLEQQPQQEVSAPQGGSEPATTLTAGMRSEEEPRRFARLGRRNVLMFVVESYGYTAFSRPELFSRLEPLLRDYQARLEQEGYAMYSSFSNGPVIGGWSWFADATLLTGRRIQKQAEYDSLLESDAQSLPRIFNEAGYHSLLAAPGTVHGEDKKGEHFYRFDESILGWDFGYKGPMFSFVYVTDQFAVNYVHREVLAAHPERPHFVLYTLVSSHGPFNRIPPYVEDWSELQDGSLYEEREILTFDNNWFSGEQYDEGYTAAVRYVLTVLFEYILRFIDNDTLVVIVGDHQPKFPITLRGAPFSVPLHVLSRDEELLSPLSAKDYTHGLIPNQAPPHPGTETFFPTFLELVGYK